MENNDWKEDILGNLIESISEKYNINKKEVILINTSDIFEGKVLNHSYVQNKNLKGQFKKRFQKGDILYSEIRPINKHFAFINFNSDDYIASTKLMVLRKKNNIIDNNYIFQLLKSEKIVHKLQVLAETRSGTFPQITFNELSKLTVNIPPIEEQKAIAHVLSTLDEKIEVNNRINEILENMAQELFNRWFVDFEFPNENGEPYKSSGGEMIDSELGPIPKDWNITKLYDLVDNVKESVQPGNHLKNLYYIPIENLTMKSIIIKESKDFSQAKSSLILFNKFDILIGAMRVYFHRVNIAPYNGVTRTTTFVLRSKNKDNILYNLFLLNRKETIEFANRTSKGSTMPYAVWENGLSELSVILPNFNLIRKFDKLIFPYINKMFGNAEENEKLKKIRDTLLPKLMSGEIRLKV